MPQVLPDPLTLLRIDLYAAGRQRRSRAAEVPGGSW
jgi:hypothetical protein